MDLYILSFLIIIAILFLSIFFIFKNKSKIKLDENITKEELFSKKEFSILIVEDNKINQKLLIKVLEKISTFKITIANDGIEGHKLAEKEDFNVIFMDIDMPNMNGIDSTKEIRKFEKKKGNKKKPIICLTANALSQDKQVFLDAGMDYYTTKPINKKEIENYLFDSIKTSFSF